MKSLFLFFRLNRKVLIGMLAGTIIGFLYWYFYACYWGTYPMSAEWWVNCSFGAIFGGFLATLYKAHRIERKKGNKM